MEEFAREIIITPEDGMGHCEMELRKRRESAKRSEAANNCTIIIPHRVNKYL